MNSFGVLSLKILKQNIPDFPDGELSHDTVNRLLSLMAVDDLKGIMSHFAELVVRNIGYNELGIKWILSANYHLPRSVFLFSTDQFSTLSRSSDLLRSDH